MGTVVGCPAIGSHWVAPNLSRDVVDEAERDEVHHNRGEDLVDPKSVEQPSRDGSPETAKHNARHDHHWQQQEKGEPAKHNANGSRSDRADDELPLPTYVEFASRQGHCEGQRL
jgi:hypothetical protein